MCYSGWSDLALGRKIDVTLADEIKFVEYNKMHDDDVPELTIFTRVHWTLYDRWAIYLSGVIRCCSMWTKEQQHFIWAVWELQRDFITCSEGFEKGNYHLTFSQVHFSNRWLVEVATTRKQFSMTNTRTSVWILQMIWLGNKIKKTPTQGNKSRNRLMNFVLEINQKKS